MGTSPRGFCSQPPGPPARLISGFSFRCTVAPTFSARLQHGLSRGMSWTRTRTTPTARTRDRGGHWPAGTRPRTRRSPRRGRCPSRNCAPKLLNEPDSRTVDPFAGTASARAQEAATRKKRSQRRTVVVGLGVTALLAGTITAIVASNEDEPEYAQVCFNDETGERVEDTQCNSSAGPQRRALRLVLLLPRRQRARRGPEQVHGAQLHQDGAERCQGRPPATAPRAARSAGAASAAAPRAEARGVRREAVVIGAPAGLEAEDRRAGPVLHHHHALKLERKSRYRVSPGRSAQLTLDEREAPELQVASDMQKMCWSSEVGIARRPGQHRDRPAGALKLVNRRSGTGRSRALRLHRHRQPGRANEHATPTV